MPALSPDNRSFVYCDGCGSKNIEVDPNDLSTWDEQTRLDPIVLDLVHAFERVMSDYLDMFDYGIIVRRGNEGLTISAGFGGLDGDNQFESQAVFNDDSNLILATSNNDEVLKGVEGGMLFVSSIAALIQDEKWVDIQLEVDRQNRSFNRPKN